MAHLREQCLTVLASLCDEQGWQLGAAQRHEYVDAVSPLLEPGASEAVVRQRLRYYHLDHEHVRALRDTRHPGHAAAWKEWLASALRIVVSTGLAEPTGALLAAEDLAQSALEELLASLPGYAYRSRFTTWAYTVIVRAARRHWTKLRAAKRSAPTAPLAAALGEDGPHAAADGHPEQAADLRALTELICALLVEQRDKRMEKIFRLWAIEDKRLRDIALEVGLDSTRVSVLLKDARELLAGSHELRTWAGISGNDAGA